MKAVSDESKRAFYERVKRSNYLASLRLEGFETSKHELDDDLPTRASILDAYRIKLK